MPISGATDQNDGYREESASVFAPIPCWRERPVNSTVAMTDCCLEVMGRCGEREDWQGTMERACRNISVEVVGNRFRLKESKTVEVAKLSIAFSVAEIREVQWIPDREKILMPKWNKHKVIAIS